MNEVSINSHTSTMFGSLTNIYNKAKMNGKLKSSNLYLLEAIYKLVGECELSLTQTQKTSLIDLYKNIISKSDEICLYTDLDELKSTFTQSASNDNGLVVSENKIHYWQETSTSVTFADIQASLLNDAYLAAKAYDTNTAFQSGKTISYNNVGLISFAIPKATSVSNYKIYDYLNNDVTAGFDKAFISTKNILLFTSKNIYGYGNLLFKLIKIA